GLSQLSALPEFVIPTGAARFSLAPPFGASGRAVEGSAFPFLLFKLCSNPRRPPRRRSIAPPETPARCAALLRHPSGGYRPLATSSTPPVIAAWQSSARTAMPFPLAPAASPKHAPPAIHSSPRGFHSLRSACGTSTPTPPPSLAALPLRAANAPETPAPFSAAAWPEDPQVPTRSWFFPR